MLRFPKCIGLAATVVLTLTLPYTALAQQRAVNSTALESGGADIKGMGMPIGRGQTSWLVMGAEFVGQSSSFIPARNGFSTELACTAGSQVSQVVGRLALPDGVVLKSVDVWRYDVSAAVNLQVSIMQHCLRSDAPDDNAPSRLITINHGPSAPGYAASSDPVSIPVDALQCDYYVQANFGAGCPAGLDLRLLGVRVNWGTP